MIQEQIQRLRESVTTCYNTVSSKNGVIPEEVGDFTVRNLPEAIESIPTSNCVLTELEVTANGEYLPEEGVDGFSKVTANFDKSGLSKVKVSGFTVNDDCINEEGRWEGEYFINTSECLNFQNSFENNTKIVYLDASNWNTSKTVNVRWMFKNASNIHTINASGWDMTNVNGNSTGFNEMFVNTSKLKNIIGINTWIPNTAPATYINFIRNSGIEELDLLGYKGVVENASGMFYQCYSLHTLNVSDLDVSKCNLFTYCFGLDYALKELDLTKWDMSAAQDTSYMFWRNRSLISIVGGRNIDDVIANNISVMKGVKQLSSTTFSETQNLDTASLLALVNGLADLTGQTEQTLTLGSVIGARLDTEQIAGVPAKDYLASIAGEKYWTIAY